LVIFSVSKHSHFGPVSFGSNTADASALVGLDSDETFFSPVRSPRVHGDPVNLKISTSGGAIGSESNNGEGVVQVTGIAVGSVEDSSLVVLEDILCGVHSHSDGAEHEGVKHSLDRARLNVLSLLHHGVCIGGPDETVLIWSVEVGA